jgi:hypothetical protein
MYSNIINTSTLNSEHNWEVLCIQLKNQQIYTFHNDNQIRQGPIFNPIFTLNVMATCVTLHGFAIMLESDTCVCGSPRLYV